MTLNLDDIKQCLFDKELGQVYTALHPETGRCIYSGKTAQEIQGEPGHKDLEVLDFGIAIRLSNTADRDQYKAGQVEPVTEEQWDEAFGCLPPERMNKCESGFTWMMSEALAGNLNRFYIKLYGLKPAPLYSVVEDRFEVTHADLIKLAQAHLLKSERPSFLIQELFK